MYSHVEGEEFCGGCRRKKQEKLEKTGQWTQNIVDHTNEFCLNPVREWNIRNAPYAREIYQMHFRISLKQDTGLILWNQSIWKRPVCKNITICGIQNGKKLHVAAVMYALKREFRGVINSVLFLGHDMEFIVRIRFLFGGE